MKKPLIIFLMLFVSIPVMAESVDKQAIMEKVKAACDADIERLCSNVFPGGGRIKDCLVSKKDQLTVGCAEALESVKQLNKK